MYVKMTIEMGLYWARLVLSSEIGCHSSKKKKVK